MKNQMEIVFTDRRQVRKGSPYRVCRLRLAGRGWPDLDRGRYQDIQAWSDDRSRLALAQWKPLGQAPGFVVVVADRARNGVYRSMRMRGCCQSIRFLGKGQVVALSSTGVIHSFVVP